MLQGVSKERKEKYSDDSGHRVSSFLFIRPSGFGRVHKSDFMWRLVHVTCDSTKHNGLVTL